jgi:flagellar hook assembly protein FlgD
MFPKTNSRILQQQPPRHSDPQQQQAGSSDFQPKPTAGTAQQMGEGSYEGSADYKKRTEEYLKKHDVEADAAAAKPRSAEEARELEKAEEEAKSHSKGER